MSVSARWLGQAGFLIEHAADRLLVDPYLSDSLARKYAGRHFDHVRMRPAPLRIEDVPPLLGVTCSHAHTDHMDPDTLTPLFVAQPEARLVCPRAVVDEALHRSGAEAAHVDALGAGDQVRLGPFTATAVPSAHEERLLDDAGDDHFLGYVVATDEVTFYHSGDCVPWDGLPETLRQHSVDVALLPVNGRDAERLAHGVPGNFTFREAVDLCQQAGIGALVPHHWGMFSFNTADPAGFDLEHAARAGVQVVIPEHGGTLDLAALA